MARCPNCKCYFPEPEDEQGEHWCPRCGYPPASELEDEYELEGEEDDRE